MNSIPNAEDEMHLCGGVGQDDQLHEYHWDAHEVDVLLQPYQSQHPSPTDIGCHLQFIFCSFQWET